MSIIGIIVLGIMAFILVMSLVFWYFTRTKGSGKEYPFILYNKDGNIAQTLKAKIKVDQANKSRKVFVFEKYDTTLPIKPPTLYLNAVGFRQITLGNKGELVYISGNVVSQDGYLNTAMDSEDVAVFTGMILENNREFENPLNKTTAAMVIGMAVIALLIMVGTVYSSVTLVGNSKEMLAVAKETGDAVKGLQAITGTLADVVEQNARIAAALTGDKNLTRRLE